MITFWIQMWIYLHFCISINIMLLALYTICHFTGGATTFLSDSAAALAEFELSEHILFTIIFSA